jgi:hypothetical protein
LGPGCATQPGSRAAFQRTSVGGSKTQQADIPERRDLGHGNRDAARLGTEPPQVRGSATALAEAEQGVASFAAELAQQDRVQPGAKLWTLSR